MLVVGGGVQEAMAVPAALGMQNGLGSVKSKPRASLLFRSLSGLS